MSNDLENLKPPSMQRAVACFWISACLVLLLCAASLAGVGGVPGGASALATNLVTFALLAWVATKLGSGRNWARWVFAVLYVLGSLASAVSIVFLPEAFLSLSLLAKASSVVQFILQTAALLLMFTHPSCTWLRAKKVASAL